MGANEAERDRVTDWKPHGHWTGFSLRSLYAADSRPWLTNLSLSDPTRGWLDVRRFARGGMRLTLAREKRHRRRWTQTPAGLHRTSLRKNWLPRFGNSGRREQPDQRLSATSK